MKSDVLLTWIGKKDLEASELNPKAGLGPIGQAVQNHEYSHIFLLSNYDVKKNTHYNKWLQKQTKSIIQNSLLQRSGQMLLNLV